MVVTEFSTETWGAPTDRKSDGLLWQFNVSTGLVAVALLVTTLAIGPVRTLRGRRRAVHLPWRRVAGVWTAVLVAAHVPGGLAMHTSGWELWAPFASAIPGATSRRLDEFTIGYWVGLFAAVALVPLVVTSSTRWLRRLGPSRWKRLHRLTYVVYFLVAVHVVTMQYGEGRDVRHVALTALLFSLALGVQVVSRVVVRSRRRPLLPDADADATDMPVAPESAEHLA
jgi:sulfoxide reductase heme-binding subunit YedZ